MDKHNLHRKYLNFLEKNYNKQRAVKEKQYLYSDLKHYGLSTASRGNFIKKHTKQLNMLSKKQALELVKFFWEKPSHEERSLALNILNLHKNSLDIGDIKLIEKIMRESRGWAFLDNLIIPLMPEILAKDKSAYGYLQKWITDDDFWVRRSALLAQLLFFRYDNGGNRELFFNMAKSQFDESWIDKVYIDKQENKRAKFFIRKAIGWTLREMSEKQPKIVFEYINENKNKMSGLTFREGSRKLPNNLKSKLNV